MESGFWDSSALVPLCVQQQSTLRAEAASRKYGIVVWWAAPIELRGAFTRLLRMRQLTSAGEAQALIAFRDLRSSWREISPSPSLRDRAERLVDRFPLKAADALQLAAALAWCSGHSRGRPFISADVQLLEAARQLEFEALLM